MPVDPLIVILPATCREETITTHVVVRISAAQLRLLQDLTREAAARGFLEVVLACDLEAYDDSDLATHDDPPGDRLLEAANDGALIERTLVAQWCAYFRDVPALTSRNHHLVVDGHGLAWIRHTLKHREGDTWTSPACPLADLVAAAA